MASGTDSGRNGSSSKFWESERTMIGLLLAAFLAVNAQDADTRALLQSEDAWASALVKRDRVVFDRLLADGFVYTENDQMMDLAKVFIYVVAGSDNFEAEHKV